MTDWKEVITELNTRYTMRELAVISGLTESALHKLKSGETKDTRHSAGSALLNAHKKT